MSKKQYCTDEELRRILEESDYEQNSQSNSSDEEENDTDGRSDVPDFDDDDSVADPDFIPHDLSPDRSSLRDINIQHSIEQHMNNDIFESTVTSHPSTSRNSNDHNKSK
ncbi:unnamed protein product [Parnassius apollo]|uniref:(apollo) hypothetical protein n=1 Tax=Parnassius apollo TaxID=110799 RepID=A0A8S3WS12_PARAO|nr:unnamed protein product [Parnassius apollo]